MTKKLITLFIDREPVYSYQHEDVPQVGHQLSLVGIPGFFPATLYKVHSVVAILNEYGPEVVEVLYHVHLKDNSPKRGRTL